MHPSFARDEREKVSVTLEGSVTHVEVHKYGYAPGHAETRFILQGSDGSMEEKSVFWELPIQCGEFVSMKLIYLLTALRIERLERWTKDPRAGGAFLAAYHFNYL